jgi:hypothetical protein
MDEFRTTSDNLDQTDEEILTYTASDEALEAATGTERGDCVLTGIVLCSTRLYCGP